MTTIEVKASVTIEALVESVLIAVVHVPDAELFEEYARQLRHAAQLIEDRLDDARYRSKKQ